MGRQRGVTSSATAVSDSVTCPRPATEVAGYVRQSLPARIRPAADGERLLGGDRHGSPRLQSPRLTASASRPVRCQRAGGRAVARSQTQTFQRT
jgi:hypothetical protein